MISRGAKVWAALLCGVAGPAAAQSVVAGSAPAPATVDGVLSEPFWAEAGEIELGFEWYPGDNTAAPVATVCRIASDAQSLYLGCVAADPRPDQVRSRYRTRDEPAGDDHIAFTLDPFGEQREGFVFIVSAAGVQSDALFGEETGQDFDWDAAWDAAATTGPAGYTVELAIPFRSLRLPRAPGRAWRLTVERYRPRQVDRRLGAFPLDRDAACLLCQSLTVSGIVAEAAGQGITLQPSFTAARTESREGADALTDDATELGLSGRWNPSVATRVSATVNPDFSQLEADELEFEINRRFAVSFPEKRAFFLEGLELFDAPGDLVFTRTVVDPTFGVKVTTRAGPASFAAFVTRDRINSLILPGPLGSRRVSLDAPVVTAVVRARGFFGAGGMAGVTVTARQGEAYHSRVAAADLSLRAGDAHRLRAFVAASDAAYPFELGGDHEPDPRGFAAQARYDYEARRWAAELGYRYTGSGFRADAGLLQRVDVQGPEGQLRRIIRGGAGSWLNRLDLVLEGQRLTDLDGRVIDGKAAVAVEYAGPFGTEVELELARRTAALESATFALGVAELGIAARPVPAVELSAELLVGDDVDADNEREADLVRAGIGAELRLGRSVGLGGQYRDERLSHRGARVYRARIAVGEVEYHFGLRTQLRALAQLRTVRRDPVLYNEPVSARSRSLAGQLVFSYRPGVRTSVFVGYSGLGESASGAASARQHTAFAKLSYDMSL